MHTGCAPIAALGHSLTKGELAWWGGDDGKGAGREFSDRQGVCIVVRVCASVNGLDMAVRESFEITRVITWKRKC